MVRGCWHHWNVLVQGCRRRGDAMGMCCCRGCRHHRDAMGMHRCRDAGTTGMQWGCIAAGDAAPWQCLALLLLQDPQDPPPRSQLVAALHFLHARSGLQQQQQQQLPCTALPPPGAAGRAVHAPNPQPTPAVHWGGGSVVGLCPGGGGGAATLLPPQIWRLCWPTCAPFCSSSTGRASAPQPEPRSSRWESCCNGCRARRVSATGSRRCRGGTEGGCDSDPPPLTPQQQQRMQST